MIWQRLQMGWKFDAEIFPLICGTIINLELFTLLNAISVLLSEPVCLNSYANQPFKLHSWLIKFRNCSINCSEKVALWVICPQLRSYRISSLFKPSSHAMFGSITVHNMHNIYISTLGHILHVFSTEFENLKTACKICPRVD